MRALAGVNSLNLSDCNGVSGVSALGRVHTLDLGYCSHISDVSALGGVHTLNLTSCYNICIGSGAQFEFEWLHDCGQCELTRRGVYVGPE